MTRGAWLRPATAAAAVVAILALGRVLPLQAWATALAEYIRGAGATGVAVFVLVYIASTVAMIPGSVLTLIAGFAYGPLWGLLLVSPTSVAAATAACLLGRHAFRDWARRRLERAPRLDAIIAAVEREGLKLVLLLRLSPLIPFNLLNYTLGLSRIRLRDYVLGSWIGMFPATAMYVYLGSLAGTLATLGRSATEASPLRTTLYVAGLAATVAVVAITSRAARKAIAGEGIDTVRP